MACFRWHFHHQLQRRRGLDPLCPDGRRVQHTAQGSLCWTQSQHHQGASEGQVAGSLMCGFAHVSVRAEEPGLGGPQKTRKFTVSVPAAGNRSHLLHSTGFPYFRLIPAVPLRAWSSHRALSGCEILNQVSPAAEPGAGPWVWTSGLGTSLYARLPRAGFLLQIWTYITKLWESAPT